jgi:hypothetical protein
MCAGAAGGASGASGVRVTGAGETAVSTGRASAGGTGASASSSVDTRVVARSTGCAAGVTKSLASDLVVAAVVTVEALSTALKVVTALLATAESTTLGLELVDANRRKGGGAVVLGSLVMDLVDGDGGVHNLRLDHLLVKNGLDLLVDVVVNMLALNARSLDLSDLGLGNLALITELATLSLEALTGVVVVAVVELPRLSAGDAVLMLLREDLLVEDGLDGAVEVVLVHLLVDNRLLLLNTLGLYRLLGDGRTDVLMDGGVMFTRHALNVVNCLSCLVHFD